MKMRLVIELQSGVMKNWKPCSHMWVFILHRISSWSVLSVFSEMCIYFVLQDIFFFWLVKVVRKITSAKNYSFETYISYHIYSFMVPQNYNYWPQTIEIWFITFLIVPLSAERVLLEGKLLKIYYCGSFQPLAKYAHY